MAAAARAAGAYVVLGVNERAGSTLYNTLVYPGPTGEVEGVHRKLMPAGGERLVWGTGDGSGLVTIETPFGRVGGMICWENYMPLARAALYADGVDVFVAPTWDNIDTWVPTLRHIAREGRLHVIGTNSFLRGSDVPAADHGAEGLYGGADDWMSRGNAAIVGPDGALLAGPLVGEAGTLYATVDAAAARATRQQFDPVGHYARADVLRLAVDRRPTPFADDVLDGRAIAAASEPVARPMGAAADGSGPVPPSDEAGRRRGRGDGGLTPAGGPVPGLPRPPGTGRSSRPSLPPTTGGRAGRGRTAGAAAPAGSGAAVSLGGSATVQELRSYLGGGGALSPEDVNVMVQAFNEHFLDLGMGMPTKYLDP